MIILKLINYHRRYAYTYFITIEANFNHNTPSEVYKKLKNYLYYNYDDIHIFHVTEKNRDREKYHIHALVFSNHQIDYAELHRKMPSNTSIFIELVKKTDKDIENVIKYMLKNNLNVKQIDRK